MVRVDYRLARIGITGLGWITGGIYVFLKKIGFLNKRNFIIRMQCSFWTHKYFRTTFEVLLYNFCDPMILFLIGIYWV